MKLKEIIIDSFAGGGGASLGIEEGLGRPVDVAINHNEAAITMHKANHPKTRHYKEDVWKLKPRVVTQGRPVGLLWASPDCTHFSRAKGAKPVKKKIRSLAWVVIKWAAEAKPRVIILENVREFEEWGPLVPRWLCRECDWKGTEGQARLIRLRRACPRCDARHLKETDELVPDPKRKGLTFRRWVGKLKAQGYEVSWRVLNAADFGAPTHRRRLFLVARRDGKPIVWPEPTHAAPDKTKGGLFKDLKPYRTAAECIDWDVPCPSIFERKRPLADATMRRIAHGVKRYVLDDPQPFIVGVGGRMGQSNPAGVDTPNNTITAKNDRAVVVPYVTPLTHQGKRKGSSAREPLPTITGAHRGEQAIVSTSLVQLGYGERKGQHPRILNIKAPLGTVPAGGGKFGLVSAFMAKHYGGTVGVRIDRPMPTTTVRGTQNQIVTANLVHMNHGDKQWSGVKEPLRTLTTGKHAAVVYSFLVRYFGASIGQPVDNPMPTSTQSNKTGLVIVEISGEPYVITDIGMRMLSPRELARGQGFPDSYILTGNKTNQVARIGNSVPPIFAKRLVEANLK